jgi:hypothetical protein
MSIVSSFLCVSLNVFITENTGYLSCHDYALILALLSYLFDVFLFTTQNRKLEKTFLSQFNQLQTSVSPSSTNTPQPQLSLGNICQKEYYESRRGHK